MAKVGALGPAKEVPAGKQTDTSQELKGLLAYLDPLQLATHRCTEESDVYAFGLVLL